MRSTITKDTTDPWATKNPESMLIYYLISRKENNRPLSSQPTHGIDLIMKCVIIQLWKKKLKNIKALGINPYPSYAKASEGKPSRIEIFHARKMMEKKIRVVGRIRSLRSMGKIAFADIEDATGKIQLLFRQDSLKGDKYGLLPNLDLGDFIEVSGTVIKTESGEITVDVDNFTILTKSLRPLPSSWYGLKDVEERYRRRYVDLIMNPTVRDIFEKRSKIISSLRDFLINEKGYFEVENPVLQPIYGGTRARPFKTYHNSLDTNFYLRISNELYLKKLIVAGFEKVFDDWEGKDKWTMNYRPQ